MDPSALKEWSNVLTAPAILIIVALVGWKAMSYLVKNFVEPLGGADGKISKFFEATQQSIEQMPKAVASIEATIRDQKDLLKELVGQHKDPEKHGFGTEATNEMVAQLMHMHELTAEVVSVLAKDERTNDDVEELRDKLAVIRSISGKYR